MSRVQLMSLVETARALRSGARDLLEFIDALAERLERYEPEVQAFVPEPGRRERLWREAQALLRRFPQPEQRPALFGVPLAVKDILSVEGFATQAGSALPAELFVMPEAWIVSRLRAAGMLIIGKTVTTEFANFAPGPTRNPHHLAHTPGGSSSGSAAAVATGLCALALGTQTIGSVIRPSAFCGIAGFKPSYGRLPITGTLLCAASYDTLGLLAADLASITQSMELLVDGWQTVRVQAPPLLGVPAGPYLQQATPAGLAAFEQQLQRFEQAGFKILRVPAFEQIETINQRHRALVAYEMAAVHREWFADYEARYRARTAEVLRYGASISHSEAEVARASGLALRAELQRLMARHGIDLWLAPSASGPAPQGLDATGDPLLQLPWTHAGLPALSLPAGANNGLPLGIQLIGAFAADEKLLADAMLLSKAID